MTVEHRRRELVEERIGIVRRVLAARGITAAVLTSRRNFAWATAGGDNHVVLASEFGVAGLAITPTDVIVLTAVNEAARIAEEELTALDIEVRALPWHEPGAVLTAARHLFGQDVMEDAALEPDIVPIRSVLAPLEAGRMRWLGGRVTAAIDAALASVKPGVTEHQAAAEALRRLAVEGIRTPVALAAADDRIVHYRHPIPTEQSVRERMMLVLVAERWGLHVAVTRFAQLAAPSDDIVERMRAVAAIHDVMIDVTRPGHTLGDVFAAARRAYADMGHPDEWRLHHQGGIIGYQGRERIAVPDDPTVIVDGMAFAWNPSIAGAKAEETVIAERGMPLRITGAATD